MSVQQKMHQHALNIDHLTKRTAEHCRAAKTGRLRFYGTLNTFTCQYHNSNRKPKCMDK